MNKNYTNLIGNKKLKVIKKNDTTTEVSLEQQRHDYFINKYNTHIQDLLLSIYNLCSYYCLHILNNKKRGFNLDFLHLIKDCVKLPPIKGLIMDDDDDEYDSSNDLIDPYEEY